jgi:hypothetical protein
MTIACVLAFSRIDVLPQFEGLAIAHVREIILHQSLHESGCDGSFNAELVGVVRSTFDGAP